MQTFHDVFGNLSYPINPNHQQDWFIKALIPLTRTQLTQTKSDTLQDALEQATQIEAMAGYPHEYRGGETLHDPSILCLQHQILNLVEKLRDIQQTRSTRPNVWCTNYLVEGHVSTECPRLLGSKTTPTLVGAFRSTHVVGVVKIGTHGLYTIRTQFHAFPSQKYLAPTEYCKICRAYEHIPRLFPILPKYSKILNNTFYKFCASSTHHID